MGFTQTLAVLYIHIYDNFNVSETAVSWAEPEVPLVPATVTLELHLGGPDGTDSQRKLALLGRPLSIKFRRQDFISWAAGNLKLPPLFHLFLACLTGVAFGGALIFC